MSWPKRRITAAIGLTLYWPGIFVLTHISIPSWATESAIVINDKVVHYLMYLVLVLLWLAIVNPSPMNKFSKHLAWTTFAVAVVYAGFDEWSQKFVGRESSFYDFIADMGGIVTAIIIFCIFKLSGKLKNS